MSKEILLVVESLANERGVSRDIIFAAIEEALAVAAEKKLDDEGEPLIRVSIDRKTGQYETFRQYRIVSNEVVPELGSELNMQEAAAISDELQPGDLHEQQIDNADFGRIAAQAAKQILVQKVREAERQKIVEQYRERQFELLSGTIKKVSPNAFIIDLGNNAEAMLPRDQVIGRESFRLGERVRAVLQEVRPESRGPQLILSRISNEMLIELFRMEVPEIQEDVIEIRSAARDPGVRAKIAVKTNDGRIDPVGACVGIKGSRVQAVTTELGGERVDIVLWDDNPAQLVINAMAPAAVVSIVVDEDANSMDVAVKADNLAMAIGRGGQNVRLATELTGWTINVMTEEDFLSRQQQESDHLVQLFVNKLGVDDELAEVLVEEGFTTIEEVAYVPMEEMLGIDGFDEEMVTEIRQRAKDVLLTQQLADEEVLDQVEPSAELLALEGMDRHLAAVLAARQVVTLDDLAELAVDELMDIEGMTVDRAGQLIMAARASWFANE